MDCVLEVLRHARKYVWDTQISKSESRLEKIPYEGYLRLNSSLNYLLHGYATRIIETFGEISRREIIDYIEYWIAAQGTKAGHPEPFETEPRVL